MTGKLEEFVDESLIGCCHTTIYHEPVWGSRYKLYGDQTCFLFVCLFM